MAFTTVAPLASGDILRLGTVTQLYNNVQAVIQPKKAASNNVQGSTLRYHALASLTSGSYTDIATEFNVSIVSDGRRLMIKFPVLALPQSTTTGGNWEIAALIDGAIDTNSILRIGFPASAGLNYGPLINYTHITGVLAAGLHTVKMQAKLASGTGTLYVYYQLQDKLMVREY